MDVSADHCTDIESRLMLPTFPTAHVFHTDPDLWVPPYEPPQDFVCIADPPGSYGNASIKTLTGQESKEPAPKPEPLPKPPQPRDGYNVEAGFTNILPKTKGNGTWMLGGTGPKKPEPKPKPPQPRDGFDLETDLTDMLPKTEGNRIWMLGGTGPKKPQPEPKPKPKPKPNPKPPPPRDGYRRSFGPAAMIREIIGKETWKKPHIEPEPKPKPPQPRDGYKTNLNPTAWILGGPDAKPLQPIDGYQVEVRALVSPADDHTPIFSWFNDRYQNKAWAI